MPSPADGGRLLPSRDRPLHRRRHGVGADAVASGAAGGARCNWSRLNEEMRALSCPIEPFEQFIKNCIGTGQIEHFFG
jgi:hypothetical protein